MEQKPTQEVPQEQNDKIGKHRHGRGSPAIFVGLLLILIGGLLFMASQGLISWNKWWQIFLIGLGVIFLIDALIRYRQDPGRGFQIGRIIPGIVLIVIGVAFLLSAINWWPLIIIAVGVAILAGGIWRRPSHK